MITITSANVPLSENNSKKDQLLKMTTQQENSLDIAQKKQQAGSDQVSLGYSTEKAATYNSSLSLENKMDDGYDLLRGLVLNIFKDQGIEYTIATESAEIDLSTLTPEKAQELIADDGYFGVEKTSERIVQFAIGMAGGDPSRLEAIRQGIDDGFQQALDAMGGHLPDISYATYDSVMHKLDDWANHDTTTSSSESPTQVKS